MQPPLICCRLSYVLKHPHKPPYIHFSLFSKSTIDQPCGFPKINFTNKRFTAFFFLSVPAHPSWVPTHNCAFNHAQRTRQSIQHLHKPSWSCHQSRKPSQSPPYPRLLLNSLQLFPLCLFYSKFYSITSLLNLSQLRHHAFTSTSFNYHKT